MGCKTSKPSAQSASSAADANCSPGSPADKSAPKPKPFAAELDASGQGPKQSYGGKEDVLSNDDLENVDAALDAMIEAQFAENQADPTTHGLC